MIRTTHPLVWAMGDGVGNGMVAYVGTAYVTLFLLIGIDHPHPCSGLRDRWIPPSLDPPLAFVYGLLPLELALMGNPPDSGLAHLGPWEDSV
jgi:hypothetical protein